MGFENDSPKRYLKIKAGHIVMNIKEEHAENYQDIMQHATAVRKFQNDNGVDVIDICFRGITGVMKNISLSDFVYKDATTTNYILTLTDDGVDYILNFQEDSGVALGLINALASIQDVSEEITIKAYSSDGKNRISVYAGNERLNWKADKDELPPLTQLTYTNPETGKPAVVLDPKTKKPVLDNTKRLAFVKDLANDIQQKLTGKKIIHYKANGVSDAEPEAVEEEKF
ncbi:MAG: hypothetical protein M9949_14355 [Candidatus Kapabacteria bacterium]|nr:hypothetical protein [Candidatus Kapabacteria bacterium]